jgi:hypothetical protein
VSDSADRYTPDAAFNRLLDDAGWRYLGYPDDDAMRRSWLGGVCVM